MTYKAILPGSQQSKRLNKALCQGYFDVDEMSFETILSMAAKLAEQLNYFDHNNQKSGDWRSLFHNSDVVIMAMISNIDRQQCEQQAKRLFTLSNEQTDAFEYLFKFFSAVEFYYQKLRSSEGQAAAQLRLKIGSFISNSLAVSMAEFMTVLKLCESMLEPHVLEDWQQQYTQFSAIWHIKVTVDIGHNDVGVLQLKNILFNTFATIMSGVGYLQQGIDDYIEKAQHSGVHESAAGLFLVFVKLFAQVQKQLNQFTIKHRDFYYRELLKFKHLAPVSDSTYLLCRKQKGVKDEVLVPKGWHFRSGQDKQQRDILYRADTPLTVSDAVVSHLYGMYLRKDPLSSPENNLNYVTQVLCEKRQLKVEDEATPFEPMGIFALSIKGGNKWLSKGGNAQRIKGEDKAKQPQSKPQIAQGLPFALVIGSPILRLSQGKRTISVNIEFAGPVALEQASGKPIVDLGDVADIYAKLLITYPQFVEPNLQVDGLSAHQRSEQKRALQAKYLVEQLTPWQQRDIFNSRGNGQLAQVYKSFLMALLCVAQSKRLLDSIYGRLFALHSLHDSKQINWLAKRDLVLIRHKFLEFKYLEFSAIKDKKAKFNDEFDYIKQSKLRLFHQLYGDMFDIKLSCENGWHEVEFLQVTPLTSDTQLKFGFNFVMTLSNEVEALVPCTEQVHQQGLQTQEPVMKVAIKPRVGFCPYSIFSQLILKTIDIDVDVKGISELVAYNQLGRLETSKMFTPLGSQPDTHAHLIFGNKEVAYKPLTELTVHFEWANLPNDLGGFEQYYQAYEDNYDNDSFQGSMQVLTGGQWQNLKYSQTEPWYPLFDYCKDKEQLSNVQAFTLQFKQGYQVKKVEGLNSEFVFNQQSRQGWFKLSLQSPVSGFGHKSYPTLMSRALVNQVKSKKQLTLPNAPYTPTINKISLDYKASSRIDFTTVANKDKQQAHQVLHLHPFGFEQIWPVSSSVGTSVKKRFFPYYQDDGNLLIGIKANELKGHLSLYFHLDFHASLLREQMAREQMSQKQKPSKASDIRWSYLANNQWVTLNNEQLIEDSTDGLLNPGIITLDLPDTPTDNNTLLPSGVYWLKVSANEHLNYYGNCFGVFTNAVKVTRVHPNENSQNTVSDSQIGIPQRSEQWQAKTSIPGLADIKQKSRSFGGNIAENDEQLVTRASERLRHKVRAVTSWDYERLILQNFAAIDKVKCFNHTIYGKNGRFPGHVLIIVRPKVSFCNHNDCDFYRVSCELLTQVKAYVSGLCGAFVKVDVREPDYEVVQVRCSVEFAANINAGFGIKRLNQAISDYFCPWNEQGINRGEGWSLKQEDLEAMVRRLDEVKFVTNFSLLHISDQQFGELQQFSLKDSVYDGCDVIEPLHKWSILMPANHHFIELVDSEQDIAPEVTGINEMEVGFNFIIQPNRQDEASTGNGEL